MQTVDLNGDWFFCESGKNSLYPAEVPGCVHQDLMRNRLIEDPFYRDNEDLQMWVGESDWVYSRFFEVSEKILNEDRVLLECDGLDTLASIHVNGRLVAKTDNMHRGWSFDVKDVLKAGTNSIEIKFSSVIPLGTAGLAKRPFKYVGAGLKAGGSQYIRKEACNYGWDWGPACLTCGIWRPIRLRGFSTARISDFHVTQTHSRNRVVLHTDIAVERLRCDGKPAPLRGSCRVTVFDENDETVAEEICPVVRGKADCELGISNPQLWWPNGMGDQPLYRVEVELLDGENVLDETERRIGLRTLELICEKDKWGESFTFACNGRRFFAKGANWIPADVFQTRVKRENYEFLLQSSVEAHFNMIRVWGGGIYEQDEFYDICDELGLCVWQDFMFSCQGYPAFDPEFMASVEAEAVYNIKRLRHHASLALYCGNNELEQCDCVSDKGDEYMTWKEYKSLFDRLLPRLVKKYDGDRAYIPTSEYTPCGDRTNTSNPDCGDGHLWNVWHGREPFEWYRTSFHRFCSEYGFQSFPEPKTCNSFSLPEERNLTSYVMEFHQRSWKGNETIMHYMTSWYRLPNGFENTVWLSQIQQGLAIKYAVEHWRRNMPRCMGSLYWQLNDCWPAASWSSIDSFERWKALHFMAKKFYAPVLVSGLENIKAGTVEVHVSSDLLKTSSGILSCRVTQADGMLLDEMEQAVKIPANGSRRVATLKLHKYIEKYSERNVVVWLQLDDENGEELSRNFVSFCRPKHMRLEEPGIKVKVGRHSSGAFRVVLTAAKPALWVWLELGEHEAQFEDNFICLEPGRESVLLVSAESLKTVAAFRQALVVKSLRDTY